MDGQHLVHKYYNGHIFTKIPTYIENLYNYSSRFKLMQDT